MESPEPESKILSQEDISRLVADIRAEVAAEAVAADLLEQPEGDLGARAGRLRHWAAHEALRHAEVARGKSSPADQLFASMFSVAFMVTCQVIDELLADDSAGTDGPAAE
jgi:hypothetical protein